MTTSLCSSVRVSIAFSRSIFAMIDSGPSVVSVTAGLSTWSTLRRSSNFRRFDQVVSDTIKLGKNGLTGIGVPGNATIGLHEDLRGNFLRLRPATKPDVSVTEKVG